MTTNGKALAAVKARMRQFGFEPKTSTEIGKHWLLVYENPFGRASGRHFIGTFEGETELYRETFPSDLAARKEFERKAEQG